MSALWLARDTIHTLVYLACCRRALSSSARSAVSSVPRTAALARSSRHVANHRPILADTIGEGFSSTNFCKSGSVRKETSWPGGSILSSISTKASTPSIPSSVTELYVVSATDKRNRDSRDLTSVAWYVCTSGRADTLVLFGPRRRTLKPLCTSVMG